MMKKSSVQAVGKYVVAALMIIGLMSCSNEQGGSTRDGGEEATPGMETVQTNEQRIAEISAMEQELLRYMKSERSELFDAKADRLLKRYRDYIQVNANDSMTAEYLAKAADLSVGVDNPKAAIAYLDRLTTDFPEYREIVQMWLFKGFIYETRLNDYANAVTTYNELIARYPNHRLADDARVSIANLSMSEEELIDKFKKLNEETAAEK